MVGTPFELDYESDRSPGYKDAYTLRVPLTGATIRSNLVRVDLEITIAGRQFSQSFAPAANLKYTFTWDGTDAFGHELQGGQVAHVRIGYVYPAVYLQPDELQRSFAQFGGTPISGDRTRREITVWQEWDRPVGVLGAGSDALGGWTLSVHHSYDPQAKILYLGDGTRRTTEAVRSQIETVAGTGSTVGGGGSRALGTSLGYVRGVTAAADGGFYIADADNNVIRRVMPGGAIQTVAGGGSPADGVGDGLQATQAQLLAPSDVAVADDGTLYISDTGNARIRRVTPNGVITTIAGGGDPAALGDGGPATSASLRQARGIALAPDGTVFVADTGHDRVRRITPDGRISTAAGGGTPADGVGDGGPAASAALDHPYDVAVDAQGVLYVADGLHHRIRRIDADGRISTLAGNGGSGSDGDGGPAIDAQIGEPQGIAAAADGTVYFADRLHHVVRKVTADGFIARAAGTGSIGFSGEGGPPLQARLSFPQDVSVAKDGALFIADAANYRIRRSRVPLPGFTDADITVPSEDGGELYQFNQNGRHLRTVDAITGAVVYEFGYARDGRLATITDGYGNVTTIQRDAAGNATAIVAPGGQQTTLTEDAAGRLASFADPAGDITRMTYSSDGLLASLTDPVGGVAHFGYDSLGRLIRDEDVTGAAVTYARVDTPRGFEVATTSPSGLTSVYEVEHLPGGDVRSTATTPSGAQSVMIFGQDGTTTITTAEGARVEATAGPDPRWGMAAPLLTKLVRATPSGLTDTVTRSRTVSLTNPADPFSIGTLVDTRTDNGRAWTRTYDAATRTLTTNSPAGRHETLVYNAHDEVVSAEFPTGSAPLLYEYDTRGRLASVQRGTQKLTYAYDAANRLIGRTDALGKTTSLGWDAADRVSSLTLPSGHRYQYGYDANGKRTSITMPSGAIHSLARDALGRAVGYTTPEGGTGFTRAFDTDHRLTRFGAPRRPVGRLRLRRRRPPSAMSDRTAATLDGQTALTYAPGDSTNRASTATRSVTGMFSASTSLSYDGALLVGEAVRTAPRPVTTAARPTTTTRASCSSRRRS